MSSGEIDGQKGSGADGRADRPRQKDRHAHALAARSRRVYRHRHPASTTYVDILRRQAVVNAGRHVPLHKRGPARPKFETQDFRLRKRHRGLCRASWRGRTPSPRPSSGETERRGRDREDKPEYKVKLSCACCFSNTVQRHRALPQLLLARARRRPGKGGEDCLRLRHRQVSEGQQQVPEEREQDHLAGRGGLPRSSCPTTSPRRRATKTRQKRPSRTSSCRRR